MKVISGGHELTVTSTYLRDDGDVVVVVRLPDKVMERLRQPAKVEWFFDKPDAESFALGTVINVSGRLHCCVRNDAGDQVWVPASEADNLSARAANACMPRQDVDLHGLKQDCERIRDEVVGLRDQVSRSVTDVNAAVVKALAAADRAADEDDLRGKYESLRGELTRMQENYNGACDEARTLRKERDEWKQRAEDTGANLRIVAAERDEKQRLLDGMDKAAGTMADVVAGDNTTIRGLERERDEWQRVAEQNQQQNRKLEDEVAGLIDSRDTWKRRAEEYRARLVKAGDKEALAQHYPGDFAAGASTQQEVSE